MKPRRTCRRDFLKLSGLSVLAGSAGLLGLNACRPGTPPPADVPTDLFLGCLSTCRAAGDSLLNCYLHCLPELQNQPRPISAESLQGRLRMEQLLRAELETLAVNQIVASAFPLSVRYPAWLAAGISIELFELVLEKSALPEFELEGWAFEHVLPHTAAIDQALAPLCALLRTPGAVFSSDTEARVAEAVEALRGRLILLGDKELIAMAEAIGRLVTRGDRPTGMRLAVAAGDNPATPPFQAVLEENGAGDISWQLDASVAEWSKRVRKDIRAIDKVVISSLVGSLLLRC
jgi:hypothetical protein